jgi:protein JSN1
VSILSTILAPFSIRLNIFSRCCLRFGYPNNDFIFDAMVDRIWEVAQGRFGARSMRACLESPHITVSQQRRVATAIILNSIPLATNPNGALLLTWLLDNSGFPSRYNLLAPRFTPHLSHLCTHKLASLTVLRIVNQKIEPAASTQIVDALFSSPGDHVLTDVLGDQVNGVAVVHKILTSPFLDPVAKESYVEATKRVLIELKVIATQAYRRLIEEVGLPVPSFQPTYNAIPQQQPGPRRSSPSGYTLPGLPAGYPSNDQGLASMMAALQMGGQNPQSAPPPLHIDPAYSRQGNGGIPPNPNGTFSPSADPFSPFGMRTPDASTPRTATLRRTGSSNALQGGMSPAPGQGAPYGGQSPMTGSNPLMGMSGQTTPGMAPPNMPPQMYQNYLYQAYQQGPQGMGAYHA